VYVVTSDTIEAHVTVAHDRVDEGREQLLKAAAYQASCIFPPPGDISAFVSQHLHQMCLHVYVWILLTPATVYENCPLILVGTLSKKVNL